MSVVPRQDIGLCRPYENQTQFAFHGIRDSQTTKMENGGFWNHVIKLAQSLPQEQKATGPENTTGERKTREPKNRKGNLGGEREREHETRNPLQRGTADRWLSWLSNGVPCGRS